MYLEIDGAGFFGSVVNEDDSSLVDIALSERVDTRPLCRVVFECEPAIGRRRTDVIDQPTRGCVCVNGLQYFPPHNDRLTLPYSHIPTVLYS